MIMMYMDWIAMVYLKHNIKQSDRRVIMMYMDWIAMGYLKHNIKQSDSNWIDV